MSYILCVNVSAVWGMQGLSWWQHVSSIESGYESADPTDDAHWADHLTHQKVNNLIIRPEIKGMNQKTLQSLPMTFLFFLLNVYHFSFDSMVLSGCSVIFKLLTLIAVFCRETWSSRCEDLNRFVLKFRFFLNNQTTQLPFWINVIDWLVSYQGRQILVLRVCGKGGIQLKASIFEERGMRYTM